MKNKYNILNYIICILIILIIIVASILVTNSNKNNETNNSEQNNNSNQSNNSPSILTISLKGDNNVTIIQGSKYEEPGFTAHDSIEGDLTNSVKTNGTVDTSTIGTYTITYTVINNKGTMMETTRKITVIEDINVLIDYEPMDITNTDITIKIKVTGDAFNSIQDPKGNIIKDKEYSYIVNENGDYSFIIKRIDDTTIEKNIKIDNIDKKKPTGSCISTITNNKTSITVTANDENGINKYKYSYGKEEKELIDNIYTVNQEINITNVTIYDKANNSTTITCKVINDTWPELVSPNYQDHSAKNYKQDNRYNRMNYLIYYPDNLNLQEKHPLVIYLHGYGEFGRDIRNTLKGSSAFANNMKYGRFQQEAIFLAPQCYAGNYKWTTCFNDLKGLIDMVIKDYNVDTNRISMTGHSLGGQAVFDFIATYPGLLAAAAPLSPSYPWNHDYTKMKDMKIAVFIGTEEGLYKTDQPEIEFLQKNGVNLKFYPLQGITHSSQKALFNGTKIIDWLIIQSR